METPDGIAGSDKELAGLAADLTDAEIKQVVQIVNRIRERYANKPFTVENLDGLRDETLTSLAGINVLASVDVAPCLSGEPPIVDILGKVEGDKMHQYGMDHELKRWEVLRANERGEDYLGQKEVPNAAKAKKRSKSGRVILP